MRDTIFGMLLVVGLYFGWSAMKKSEPTGALLPQEPKLSKTYQGEPNERPNHASSRQARHHGQSKRSSEPSSEIEGLPSIYQDQEEQRYEPTVDSKNSDSPKPEFGAIKGVPIRAWVQNRTALPNAKFTAYPTDEKMRVFVQCMEVKKKGMESVSESDCNGLIAKKEASPVTVR